MAIESDADFVLRFKAAVKDAVKIYKDSWIIDYDHLGGTHTASLKESCVQAIEKQKLPKEMIFVLDELIWASADAALSWAE
jgi:hypothetical protein